MDSKANYIVVSDPSVSGDPIQAIKNKWANIPEGECFCKISVGSLYCALIQKINNGEFGSALIIGFRAAIYRSCERELDLNHDFFKAIYKMNVSSGSEKDAI